jgi:hypothetical protein
MSRTIKQRGLEGNFDCLLDERVQEVFVDGASSIQIGVPNSKILFHSVEIPVEGQEIEQRFGKILLTIPTHSLFELFANIATSTDSGIQKQTENAANQFSTQLLSQVKRLVDLNELSKKQ